MSPNPSRIQKWLQISQVSSNLTTILAAIALGIWGIYSTLYVKQEQQITEYQLKELQQKTLQVPHVQAKLETSLDTLPNGQHLLQVNVVLSNPGNKEGRVLLDDESLLLVPVEFRQGVPSFLEPKNLGTGRFAGTLKRSALNWIDLGAGESYTLTYVHSIEQSGTYLIHFLSLNGMVPPAERVKPTTLSYKYAVGSDSYITIK